MSLSYLYSSFSAKIFATTATLVAGVVTLKLVSVYLTPTAFGLFIVASQLLAYLPLVDGGLRTVLNRELLAGNAERRNRLLRFSQSFYSWFGVVLIPVVSLMMLIYWLTPNVARSGEPFSLFLAIGFSFAVLAFAFAQGNLLVGLQDQGTYYWIVGIANILQLLLLYAGFRLKMELWAYPLANGIAFLVSWPLIALAIRRRMPGLKIITFRLGPSFAEDFRSLRRSALLAFLSQVSTLLLFTVDLVIVGLWVSLQEAALYALLLRVLSIVRSFIQSVGEVSWPLLAKNIETGGTMTRILLNLNAWIYGSVAGALAVFLLPFLAWYMNGNEWVASEALFFLLLSRFVIVGLQSPAGYFLISRGEFGLLARFMWRELAAALVFSMAMLGSGGIGVALGFLASTAFGTLASTIRSYAGMTAHKPARVFLAVWSRALVGGAASAFVAWALLPAFPGAYGAIGGVIAAGVGLTIALGFGAFRVLGASRVQGLHWKQIAKCI